MIDVSDEWFLTFEYQSNEFFLIFNLPPSIFITP